MINFFTFLLPLFWVSQNNSQLCYDDNNVLISKVNYSNDNYFTVTMLRQGNLVKGKYFAAKDKNGNSVYDRYLTWKKTNPKVVLISSGTYWDGNKVPQGLTIENGVVVNRNLIKDRMDALVVVYPNGGIAVSNLKEGNLKVTNSSGDRVLDIRNSIYDLDNFISWAQIEKATTFQTHLLIFKSQIVINPDNSSLASRERRFLAVGTNSNGQLVHMVIHSPLSRTLYEGTAKVFEFLTNTGRMNNIIFMINLDTGAQDVFELYNSDCTINDDLKGAEMPREAANLLVYYF